MHRPISQFGRRCLSALTPFMSLLEAGSLMCETRVRVLPVVDDQRRPIGTLLPCDIVKRQIAAGGAPLHTLTVGEAMRTPATYCHEADEAVVAQRQMCRRRTMHVALVDDEGRLTGMVSLGDLARAAEATQGRTTVERDKVGAILRAIVLPPRRQPNAT